MSTFSEVFGTKYPVIGMIHLPPLFGYPDFPGTEYIQKKLLKEAKKLTIGGVSAIMIENNYDLPHHERISPENAVLITSLIHLLSQNTKLPIGVSLLWNDYLTSMAICSTTPATFFRAPAFVDTVKTKYGVMSSKSKEINQIKKVLGLKRVAILADIQVKHSEMIDKRKSIEQSATEAVKANADALIITGKWTGDSPKTSDLSRVRKIFPDFPILVGSGATSENISSLLQYANGVIVGTAIKTGKIDQQQTNLKPYQETISQTKTNQFVAKFNKSKGYSSTVE